MSESELEYRSGALKLERRLHNSGQFIQFKAFRVARAPARCRIQYISRKSINHCVRDGATIIRNYVGKTIFADFRGFTKRTAEEGSPRRTRCNLFFA